MFISIHQRLTRCLWLRKPMQLSSHTAAATAAAAKDAGVLISLP